MPTRISFALEYSLGHVTHAQNLKAALRSETGVDPTYFDIPFDNTPLPLPWSLIGPIRSNWTARASIVAYLAIKSRLKSSDAAFFHTQVTSIFSSGLMRRLPSIVSLDATPVQYDVLGAVYNHKAGGGRIEKIKKRLNEKSFAAAQAVVSWSEWAKDSLVADYGVPAGKIKVIPPGIDLEKWLFRREPSLRDDVRILFVGADFERKGGANLLSAYKEVVASMPNVRLDVVTKTTDFVNLPSNVTVHNGLKANSDELMALYRTADMFAFPTRGDCLPLAVMEAMAAGLPIISTNVGALSEAVVDGITGIIVDVDDRAQLIAAMTRLAKDGSERFRMGARGRERAQAQFDAKTNYRSLVKNLYSIGIGG